MKSAWSSLKPTRPFLSRKKSSRLADQERSAGRNTSRALLPPQNPFAIVATFCSGLLFSVLLNNLGFHHNSIILRLTIIFSASGRTSQETQSVPSSLFYRQLFFRPQLELHRQHRLSPSVREIPFKYIFLQRPHFHAFNQTRVRSIDCSENPLMQFIPKYIQWEMICRLRTNRLEETNRRFLRVCKSAQM